MAVLDIQQSIFICVCRWYFKRTGLLTQDSFAGRPTFISLGKNHGTAHVDLLHYEPDTLFGIQIRIWGERFNYLIQVDAQGKPDSVLDIHGAETGFASILGMQEVYDLLSEVTPVPA